MLSASEAADVLSAATSADATLARSLLKKVPLANRSTLPGGEPASLVAARYGTPDVLVAFLDAGANIESRGPNGWTPLFAAITASRADNVKLLLERGADPHAKALDNLTALALALEMAEPKIVGMIQSAASDSAATPQEIADLLQKAAATADADTVGLLLKRHKVIDITDDLGWTPLFYAAASGNTAVVSLLLDAKANVNHVARNGVTALMVSAFVGSDAVVDLLLNKGANKAAINNLGQTAAAIAQGAGAAEISAKLGLEPDRVMAHRLLAAAAARKDSSAIKALLDKGAPAARPANAAADTPALVVAACAGDADIVKLLLARGAKVDESDANGVTPLIAAALCNRKQVASALMAAKAAILAKTKDGLDALTAAAARGHADVVAVLSPTATPTLDTAVDALQRKDLKVLTALVRGSPELATRSDSRGVPLLGHAILVADSAMLEAVAGMPGVDVNEAFGTDTPLTFAINANRQQAARTLIKLGARPTALVYQNAERKTSFEIAAERGATELLVVMSQASRNELRELQSNLFTMGLLDSPPDGSWGPGTKAAWEKVRDQARGVSGATMGAITSQLASKRLRVCNQTSAKRDFALYSESLNGSFNYLVGWYPIDSGKCRSLANTHSYTKYYLTGGHYKLQAANTGGATFTYCTKNERMIGRDVTQALATPPCVGSFTASSFVLITDQSAPFLAR